MSKLTAGSDLTAQVMGNTMHAHAAPLSIGNLSCVSFCSSSADALRRRWVLSMWTSRLRKEPARGGSKDPPNTGTPTGNPGWKWWLSSSRRLKVPVVALKLIPGGRPVAV